MATFLITGEPYSNAASAGVRGGTGTKGATGNPGESGYNDVDCTTYCKVAPTNGAVGGFGTTGSNGTAGAKGRPAPLTPYLDLGVVTGVVEIKVGGGTGQTAGMGGQGGTGGQGGDPGNNPSLTVLGRTFYICTAARQGLQGPGGKGGNGGRGGDGGDGATVTAWYDSIAPGGDIRPTTFFGTPGLPGNGGPGGISDNSNLGPGNPGGPGSPGSSSNIVIRKKP